MFRASRRRTLTAPRHLTTGGHTPGAFLPPKQLLPHPLSNRLNKRPAWRNPCTKDRVTQSPRGANRVDKRGQIMRMILAATLAIVPLLAKGNEPVKRLDEAAVV